MSRVLTTVSVGALFAFAAPDALDAQVCAGQAAFGRYALQVAATSEFNGDARAFGGSMAVGGRRPFAGLAVSRTTFDGIDGSSITLGGGFGYQVPLDPNNQAQLCPVASVAFAIGPNNVDLSGGAGTFIADLRETDLQFGVSAGVIAAHSDIHRRRFIPTASFTVVRGTATLKNDLNGTSSSESKTWELVSMGAGVVFNQSVTLLAGTTIPMGLDGASTTYHVSLSLNVSKYAP